MKTNLGKGVAFERIRRITGYLVGSLTTWNDAKKAEERDRVKHDVRNERAGAAILTVQEASERICAEDYAKMKAAFFTGGTE